MNRKEYIRKSLALGVCSGTLILSGFGGKNVLALDKTEDDIKQLRMEKEFIQNWLSDLLETIDKEVDPLTRVKLMEGCGKGCFNRFKFKQEIAEKGNGSLEKLIEAYKNNFEIWQDGDTVHIRYGEVSPHCYCPAANYRKSKPNDFHCECTRTTHQTIFETALKRPFKVEILESLRRGGKTCHFLVHLS
jgi:hypothetical protein